VTADLFKAVSPSGFDFHTGTIDYASALGTGKPVRHPCPDIGFTSDHTFAAAHYLSAATVATDCTGMKWPCRLLRVQPVGVTASDPKLRHKIRCEALLVVEELPGYYALGPQGPEVAALIERAARITVDDVKRLAAAWDAARVAARVAARDAAWDAAWDAARVDAWDAAGVAARVAVGLLVRDVLPPEHYQTLTRPWATVIGPCHPDDPPAGAR
jgi:hypothetical protein